MLYQDKSDEVATFPNKCQNGNKTTARQLMPWKALLQFDIMVLALCYAFMKCAVGFAVANVAFMSINKFHWTKSLMMENIADGKACLAPRWSWFIFISLDHFTCKV